MEHFKQRQGGEKACWSPNTASRIHLSKVNTHEAYGLIVNFLHVLWISDYLEPIPGAPTKLMGTGIFVWSFQILHYIWRAKWRTEHPEVEEFVKAVALQGVKGHFTTSLSNKVTRLEIFTSIPDSTLLTWWNLELTWIIPSYSLW